MPEAKTIPAKYIFLDIVGFTHNRSVEAQSDIIRTLNDIVQSGIKERGIKKDEVMFLPTGDGICIALLNVGSPYDIHLQIALDIVGKVYKHSINTPNKMRKFEVRVGVNAYTDNLVTDINGNQNIAGAGVNLAARIMKMADGNQILISKFVFDDFRHYEKYSSSFKAFRAQVREDVFLPVYQFTAQGCEGLNVSTPAALRNSAPGPKPQVIEQPRPQTVEPPRPVQQVPKAPVGVEKPVFVTQPSISRVPPVNTQTEHTLSFLKGILPEPERTETEAPAARTEVPSFLDHSEPKKSRAFVWAFAVILMVGVGALGAWFWKSKQASPASSRSLANAPAAAAPTAAPVNNPAEVPNQEKNQTTAQAVQPPTPADAKPNPAAETRVSNNAQAFKPGAETRRAPVAPRPVVQRAIAQRPQPKPQPAKPKPQTARAVKPKPSKRVTLDDLIN
jgi:hypothetical protein